MSSAVALNPALMYKHLHRNLGGYGFGEKVSADGKSAYGPFILSQKHLTEVVTISHKIFNPQQIKDLFFNQLTYSGS